MSDNLIILSSPEFQEIVQDMKELLSNNRLAFLLGAGCSKNAGLPLMDKLTTDVMTSKKIHPETKKLLEIVSSFFSGAQPSTIEDYLSEIVDLLSIAERRSQRGSLQTKITVGDLDIDATQLHNALNDIKEAISSEINKKGVNVTSHQQFMRAIHNSLQAGKQGRGVDYYVLNYDTLIEDALGLEQVTYCDGFSGAATGWWDANLFDIGGKAARVFKLHGSIDWCLLDGDTLPRRIRSELKSNFDEKHVLIYPAATKYLETQRDPFAKMLQYMRQTLRPDKKKEMVLAICGYSFSDSHIDLEIENALHQSEGRLTIAAFVATDNPEGKLKKWINDPSISEQIRVYSNKGFFHGDTKVEWSNDILWWKFENLARILDGER